MECDTSLTNVEFSPYNWRTLAHSRTHTHTQKTLNSTNYKVFASFSRLARVQNIVRSSKGAQFSICFWKGHERDIPLVFISSYPKSSVNDRWNGFFTPLFIPLLQKQLSLGSSLIILVCGQSPPYLTSAHGGAKSRVHSQRLG